MKKAIKWIIVLALIAAGVAGWWYTTQRLDGVVEREISEAASKAFGTDVTLENVDINVLEGSVTLENLAVGNPEGFNEENAFVFGTIEAAVNFRTRGVDRVILDDSQIFVEEKNGRINVQELKKTLESKMSDTVSAGQPGGSDPEQDIYIRQFLMRSTTATLESGTWNKLTELDVDEIEMRDLRGTPDAVGEQIASRVIDEILDEAQKALLRAKAEDVGERALDKLKEMLGDDQEEGGG